jgi:hypothetical protein
MKKILKSKTTKLKLSHYTPWRRLGERRYSSYSFLASALDGGEWSVSRTGRALARERILGTHWTVAGWVPEPVWTRRLNEKSFASAGDWPPVVQQNITHFLALRRWDTWLRISITSGWSGVMPWRLRRALRECVQTRWHCRAWHRMNRRALYLAQSSAIYTLL